MSEDEDRLRRLLRAPLSDAAPVRFEPARVPSRMHRAATITIVVTVVALIAGSAALFRAMADRSEPVAQRPLASNAPTHPQRVPLVALARGVPCDVRRHFASPAQLRTFHPVVALRCDDVLRGSGLPKTRAIAAGPFGSLVRDLERPDGVAPDGQFCATFFDVQPQVLLVDAAGRYLKPRFPRDGCGHVRGTPAYMAYLDLTWHNVSDTNTGAHRTR